MEKKLKRFFYILLENLSYFTIILPVLWKNKKTNKTCIVEKVSYGEEKHQYLVVVLPKSGITKKNVICFTHGGGWRMGNPMVFRFVGRFFAKFGYATILPGYRLVPKYQYPTQVEDTIKSIEIGIKALKKHQVDVTHLILAGHSAGAQLATLIGYKSLLHLNINGIVSIGGPINFSVCQNNTISKLIHRFVSMESYEEADPYNHMNGQYPILCIHGKHDPIVERENAITTIDKMKLLNDKSKLIMINKGLHANVIKLFWFRLNQYNDLLVWLNQFE